MSTPADPSRPRADAPIEGSDTNATASRSGVLKGTTWLVVSHDLAWADGVARALRSHGSRVHMVDVEGRGVARLRTADAQVALLPEGTLPDSLQRALIEHPGLRHAARVPVSASKVWPLRRSRPELEVVMRACGPALRADRNVRAQAQVGVQFTVELAALGLVRVLRTLAAVPAKFVVQLSLGDADAYVALAYGEWIGASYRPKNPRGERLDGMAALQKALSFRSAGCLVLPASTLKIPSWRRPLDAAMAQALRGLHEDRERELEDEPTRRSGPPTPSMMTTLTDIAPAAVTTAPSIPVPGKRSSRQPRTTPMLTMPRRRIPAPLWAAAAAGVVAGGLALVDFTDDDSATRSPSVEETTPQAVPLPAPTVHVEPVRPAPPSTANTQANRPGATTPPAPASKPESLQPSAAAREEEGAQTELRAAPAPEPAPEPQAEVEGDEGSWERSRELAKRAKHEDDAAARRSMYEEALALDSGNPHAVVGMALLARDAGEPSQALEWMQRAVELRRRRVSYRVLYGNMLLDAGRAREALESYEVALELRPSSRPAAKGMQRASRALGNAD